MASVAPTSPYIYLATISFAFSALSSDLLFIRGCLTFGFLFLVLCNLSGFTLDGSFRSYDETIFFNGVIDICTIINFILFVLNLSISTRLILDELPKHMQKYNELELALFRFFTARCGCTSLEFNDILKNGKFVDFDADVVIPHIDTRLYLVLEGVVECECQFMADSDKKDILLKRSGDFFDIKMFNIFSLPVGFDNHAFSAKTIKKTKVFCWDFDGLVNMRDSFSPALEPYWVYVVLRTLTNVAVNSHLRPTDTYYDSWLIPEDKAWLNGAPSRDFTKPENPEDVKNAFSRTCSVLKATFLNIIPPHGIRHQAKIGVDNPREKFMELMHHAKSIDDFRFLSKSMSAPLPSGSQKGVAKEEPTPFQSSEKEEHPSEQPNDQV